MSKADEKMKGSGLSIDRAAFILLRVKRVFKKKKQQLHDKNLSGEIKTLTVPKPPPLLRSRTLPSIVVPGLNILQAQIDAKYRGDYIRAARDYSDIYNKAVREINLSNSESQIVAIVNDFDRYTREMADIVVSINYTLAKIQIQTLQVLDKLVVDLKNYARTRADKTNQLIQDCVKKVFIA